LWIQKGIDHEPCDALCQRTPILYSTASPQIHPVHSPPPLLKLYPVNFSSYQKNTHQKLFLFFDNRLRERGYRDVRARLKRLKFMKLRNIVVREGVVNGVWRSGFASVGFDGSAGLQGIEMGSDLISDPQLLLRIQNLVAPAGLRRRQLRHRRYFFSTKPNTESGGECYIRVKRGCRGREDNENGKRR